jgi:hypothetical protein
MAGLDAGLATQLRAIGVVRWRLFVNSLRSIRGRLNLVSRGLAALLIVGAAIGGATTLGAVAWEWSMSTNFSGFLCHSG